MTVARDKLLFRSKLNPWVLAILLPVLTFVAQNSTGALLDPTGASRVGRATVQLMDTSRTMPDSRSPRRLMLHIWYPASAAANGVTLPYMEGLERAGSSVTADELALLKTVRTHSFAAPAAMPSSKRLPVVLFSHGEQTNAFLYSNLNEELASHGYVVIGVDHPGAALFVAYPNGTVVAYSDAGQNLRGRIADRVADLRFVRNQIPRLEVNGRQLEELVSGRVGAFGHSSGGIAAAQLCQQPPVVDACLNLDGRLDGAPITTAAGASPPLRPFMYVTKPFRSLTDAELRAEGITREQSARAQADTWARDGRLLSNAGQPSYRATLRRAEHENFSDESLLQAPEDQNLVKLTRILRDLVVEFFDTTLTDTPRKSVAPRSDNDIGIEVLASPQVR